MSANWEHIQNLFLEAVELSSEERARFLDTACGDDTETRREVESLLAHDAAGEGHINDAIKDTAQSLFQSVTLQTGTIIGDYEILKLLGAGGMGEVYQARDRRLARNVAMKVLPALHTDDPERLRRFEQEAQAAAALSHPNILAVYQLGTYLGTPYLVSELLEGVTLRDLMKRAPLPSRKAIEYGQQIARGLAAAHAKGITHRDLKPENLFVTTEGYVKILDFGLAKLTHVSKSIDPATEAGQVMGTVGYMSPEQVRGETADYRADFFATGAILYEMLSGQRAFRKATAAETMSSILNEDPASISQLLPAAPPALLRVVRRCLEKDREQRFQSAADLAFALEALSDPSTPGAPAVELPEGSWRNPGWLGAIIGGTGFALLLLAYYFRPAMPLPHVIRIVQLTKSGAARSGEPLYTDGPRVYYQSNGPLATDWQLRQVLFNGDQDAPAGIPAGQFHVRGLSPDDSEFVALFYAQGQSTVWKIPVAGGSPRRVGNLLADDIAWSHDGSSFAYAQGNQLFLAKADGTSSRVLATAPKVSAQGKHVRFPATAPDVSPQVDHVRWSPDDRRIRFTLISEATQALWEVGVDGSYLHELRFNWPGNGMECCGEWTLDGRYFVFKSSREGISNLWALEEKSDWWRRANRDPVQLTSGPVNYDEPVPSRNGKSIFAIGVQPSGELVRYDAGRKDFVPFLGGRSLAQLAFSPDGRWLAYVAYPEGTLWRARSDGAEQLQLTFSPVQVFSLGWSADQKWIAFTAAQPGQLFKNYVISADGGNPEPFPPESLSQTSPTWIPGRDALMYSRAYGADNPALYVFDRPSGSVEKIPGTDGLYGAAWSPDGRYVLAVDAATDQLLLVDFRFGKRTEIAGPAAFPTWSPDSRYIYFVRWGVNWIFRVRVPSGQEEKFLEIPFRQPPPWPFTLAPDGGLILLRAHGHYDVYSLSLLVQ